MPTSVNERRDLVARLKDFPSKLDQALAKVEDGKLDTPYRAGGWTIRQLVHHLADSHANAYIRTRLVATEDFPPLKPYNQDAWAELPDSQLPIDVSIDILRGLHARWAAWLETMINDETFWQRAGNHLDNGRMTLDDLLAAYVAHGDKHLGHISNAGTGE